MRKVLLLLCLPYLMSLASGASAASFDCRRATSPDERAVCSDTKLSKLDDEVSVAFAQAKHASGNQVVAIGRRFLASRRACEADRACIGHVYEAMLGTYRALGANGDAQMGTNAPDLPSRVGDCVTTAVAEVTPRIDNGQTLTMEDFDSGTAISFTNGGFQVSYEREGALLGSRKGDPIRMCLVSIPRNCPSGDNRGRVYSTTNLRTQQTWSLPDSQHDCGGA